MIASKKFNFEDPEFTKLIKAEFEKKQIIRVQNKNASIIQLGFRLYKFKIIKDEKIIESLEFVDNFKQTSYAIFTDKTKALVSIKKGFKEINGEFHSIFDNDDTHQILPGWGLTEINGNPWIVDENDILGSLSYNYSRAGIADLIAKISCTEMEV
jgi:hypothetical protein